MTAAQAAGPESGHQKVGFPVTESCGPALILSQLLPGPALMRALLGHGQPAQDLESMWLDQAAWWPTPGWWNWACKSLPGCLVTYGQKTAGWAWGRGAHPGQGSLLEPPDPPHQSQCWSTTGLLCALNMVSGRHRTSLFHR